MASDPGRVEGDDEYRAFVRALSGTSPEGSPQIEELLRHDRAVQEQGFRVGDHGVLDLLELSPEDIDPDATTPSTPSFGPAPSSLPKEGDSVGRYRIVRELGRGGMGVVYLAEDTAVGRSVAFKGLLRGGLERFEQETRAIALLEHPGIVRFYDAGQIDGLAYYTMEYVPGPTLEDRYKAAENGVLEVREAVNVIAKVARAVAYAHARGVLHRDLKPGNILLGEDGTPRVGDFGLAKRLGDQSNLTMSGEVFGSPAFMAPEQAKGSITEVGEEADVYGLGATLYCAIVGRPPFQGADSFKVLSLVASEPPTPPSRLVAGAPADIDTICLKCLEKEPTQRYPSAAALADDLERFLRGEPIAARPVSPVEKLRRWCVRKPTAAGLVAATLAAMLLLAGWGAREVVTQQRAQSLYSGALVTRADLYAQQGKWRDALADLAEAERVGAPDPRQIVVKRAEALLAVNETDAFEATLTELGAMEPLGPYLGEERLLRGLSLLIVGAADDSQQAIEESLACESLSPAKRCIAEAMLAKTSPEALAKLRESVERDPTSHFAQQYLIGCLTLMGRYDEAATRCRVAIALFPESPSFRMLDQFIATASGAENATQQGSDRVATDQVATPEMTRFRDSLEVLSAVTGQFAGAWRIDATEAEFYREQEALAKKLAPLMTRWEDLVSRRGSHPARGDRFAAIGVPCVRRAFQCLGDVGSMRTFGFVFTGKGDVPRIDRIIQELATAYAEHPDAMFQLARGRLLYARGRRTDAANAFEEAATSVSVARETPRLGAYSAAVCGLELHRTGDPHALEIARRNLVRCVPAGDWSEAQALKLMSVAVELADYEAAAKLAGRSSGRERDLLLAKAALRAGRLDAAVESIDRLTTRHEKDRALPELRSELADSLRSRFGAWLPSSTPALSGR
jgi:tetratricopeptide (TPR) repeat protein/predicted Ser/Thr protein kinase